MSSKNERFGAFFGQFPFGSLVFFSYCRPIEPIGSGPALWGITGSRSNSWSWPATESDRENPATKRGCLRYRGFFGADVKDKNLVKKLMIPTSLGPFFAPEDGVFFFGKTDYFVKNRCWQWELEPFGWELGCFHGFNNCSQQDHSSLSKCWRKGSKNQIFIRSSINLHIIIYMQKNLAPWFFGEVGYFVGQIFPVFFFGLEKKHHHREIPVSGGQQTRPLAAQQATLCTEAELWDKMDRET